MPNGNIGSRNLRRRMRTMIEKKKVDTDEAVLILLESNLDVMESVQLIFDLPFIKLLVFIKSNKKMGAFIIISFIVVFELWHVTEFRNPILENFGFPTNWFR